MSKHHITTTINGEPVEYLCEREWTVTRNRLAGKWPLHIQGREAVKRRVQVGRIFGTKTERIDASNKVAAKSIRADKLIDPVLHAGHAAFDMAAALFTARTCRRIENTPGTERRTEAGHFDCAIPVLQRFKISAPLWRNRAAILQVVGVEAFDKSKV